MTGPTPDPRYQLGLLLGRAIETCFEAVALLDGVPTREAIDQWVAAYLADRIVEEGGEALP